MASIHDESSTKSFVDLSSDQKHLGFMQTLGTLQAYLELHQLSEYSSRDIGWIAGVFTSLALFLGVQIGPVFDTFGDAFLAPLGCVLYIPVFFLLAQCEKYWQFMLTLGVLGGIGAGIFSVVGVGVIGNRFVRRRGVAMGCALSGSSIGGVVMPLMLRSLLPKVGWAWSMRAVAFLIAFASIGGVMCLRRLSPRRRSAARYSGVALNFSVFTSGSFVFVTLGLAALEFAVFGMFSLLPTYAIKSSFSSGTGFLLLAIANATSCMGRLIPGIAGDRIGHFNMLLCMILFTAVCTTIILVPFGSSSLGAIYAFAAIWGFGSGSFISLTPVCMGKICHADDYGRYFGRFDQLKSTGAKIRKEKLNRVGTMYFVVSFALLVATPLSSQMLEAVGTRGLACLYIGLILCGGVSFLSARQLLYGLLKVRIIC